MLPWINYWIRGTHVGEINRRSNYGTKLTIVSIIQALLHRRNYRLSRVSAVFFAKRVMGLLYLTELEGNIFRWKKLVGAKRATIKI